MSGYGMADSAELATLTRAVDDYCNKYRIADAAERESIAIRVLQLFELGVINATALSDGLEFLEDRLKQAG